MNKIPQTVPKARQIAKLQKEIIKPTKKAKTNKSTLTTAFHGTGLRVHGRTEPRNNPLEFLLLLAHAHKEGTDGLGGGGTHVGDRVQQAVLQTWEHLHQIRGEDLGIADHTHLEIEQKWENNECG